MSDDEEIVGSDEEDDEAKASFEGTPAKKYKRSQELVKPFPDAYLVDTDSTNDKVVLEAWAGTTWAIKQESEHRGVVVEIVVPPTCTEVAKLVWKTWVHGARKRIWMRRNVQTGEVTVCPGIEPIVLKTAKCRWCNQHKLFKTSNQILKTHAAVCPSKPIQAQSQGSEQQSQQSGATKRVRTGARGGPRINDAAVRMIAALALSFSFFTHPTVKEFLALYADESKQHQVGRLALAGNTMTVADRDRSSLLGLLKAVATTIAADGGTINVRKLLGIGLGALEKCFFWKLITVKSTAHLHVSKHLESAVISLMSAMVWVIAIVGDNATAMQKGIRLVCNKFGLCALRCACHNIQLVVKDMRLIMPFVMQASRVHANIMQRMTPDKTDELKEKGSAKLKKFSNIKWNTEHDAMECLLAAQGPLVELWEDLKDQFQCIRESLNFFAPLRMATKILECDKASMLEVITCVHAIHVHLEELPAAVDAVKVKAAFLHRIRHNFASPLLLCVFFAIPGFLCRMADVQGHMAQFILDTVVTVGTTAVMNYERLIAQGHQQPVKPDLEKRIEEEMRLHVNAFFQEGRISTTKRFNTDMLLCFWAKRTAQFGRLALFMVAAIQALPAEACIERFFSHGKLVLDATRMRLQDRPTEAQMFVKVNDAMRRRPHPKPAAEDVGMLELMTHTPPTWTTLINLAVIFAEAVHAGEHEALGAKLEWRELDAPASDSDASEASDDAQGDDTGDDESD